MGYELLYFRSLSWELPNYQTYWFFHFLNFVFFIMIYFPLYSLFIFFCSYSQIFNNYLPFRMDTIYNYMTLKFLPPQFLMWLCFLMLITFKLQSFYVLWFLQHFKEMSHVQIYKETSLSLKFPIFMLKFSYLIYMEFLCVRSRNLYICFPICVPITRSI